MESLSSASTSDNGVASELGAGTNEGLAETTGSSDVKEDTQMMLGEAEEKIGLFGQSNGELEDILQVSSQKSDQDSEMNVQSACKNDGEEAGDSISMDVLECLSQDHSGDRSPSDSMLNDDTMKDCEDSSDTGPPVLEKMVANEKSVGDNIDCDELSANLDESFSGTVKREKNNASKTDLSDNESSKPISSETDAKNTDFVGDMDVDQDTVGFVEKFDADPISKESQNKDSTNASELGERIVGDAEDSCMSESNQSQQVDSMTSKHNKASEENSTRQDENKRCDDSMGTESLGESADTRQDKRDSQSPSNSEKDKTSKEEETTFNLLNIKIKQEKPDYDYEGTDLPQANDNMTTEPLKKPKVEKDKGYISDTVNELLGLYGYDKVDESTKDNLDSDKTTKSSKSVDSTPKSSQLPVPSKSSETPKKDTTPNRVCSECGVTKGLKYQVLFQGTTRFMCSDTCFRKFRGKQKLSLTSQGETTLSKEVCSICHNDIRNGHGYLPQPADKVMCSETCMKRYQQIYEPRWECVECKINIHSRSKCLMWETMEFCSEDCLGKYQSYLGSHCACCQAAVQRPSLGKYCVRFGLDIRQFCSGRCLEDFKKGLKVCTFCQKDLSNSPDGFVAPVGDKGKFKDFCSPQCMERYEAMNNSGSAPPMKQCSVCKKIAAVKVKVNYEGKTHNLCSDVCVASFRYTNKIVMTICDSCYVFFKSSGKPLTLQFEGSTKRFCSKNCINLFVLSHRKIVPCSWCKVKKYNFDMIERADSNNHVQLFCSLNCLSLFRVSLNASSSRTIRCDHCQQFNPAQYHLTMSDASIRNFCSYQCVMNFQSQFGSSTVLTTTGSAAPVNKPTVTLAQGNRVKTVPQATTMTPVISSVMSLAPHQAQGSAIPVSIPQFTTPALNAKVNNLQKVVSSQPIGQPQTATIVAKPSTVTTAANQAIRDVIVKPPPPRLVKNKGVMSRPLMLSKAVSCKPLPCHKSTQTDEGELYAAKPSLLTVPVPIYVPVPMHMYSRPVPTPLPFPLPIPVPIFIPTSKGTAPEIFKHIKEIQDKIPDNPFEAELLMMAEMVAADTATEDKSDEEKESSVNQNADVGMILEESCQSHMETGSVRSFEAENSHDSFFASNMIEPLADLEAVLDQQSQPAFHGDGLQEERADDEDLALSQKSRSRQKSVKRSSRRLRDSCRQRSRKRQKLDETYYEDTSSTDATVGNPEPGPFADVVAPKPDTECTGLINPTCESNMCLKYTFGVNAWKHWVVEKNAQLEKGSQSSRKLKLFKTDLLQLTADELNYSLCLFVKEVRKPNGEVYAPDSIYYLCLGIQQYLFENGRIDNIFMDSYYEKFTECLNEVLQRQELLVDTDGFFVTRIEEEILWESKQLGAHSPHVLLNTLMYFSTKYFILKTVEEHLCLSFSHVVKHWRKSTSSKPTSGPRNILLRYYPPVNKESGKKKEDQFVYEQSENLENPLRCPVKLYEFYLSKCPESVKMRNDVFYLHPERSCVPDSPVWYSTQPLGRETIAKMLQRIKMVREIQDAHQLQLHYPVQSMVV